MIYQAKTCHWAGVSLMILGRCKIALRRFGIGPVLPQGRFAFQEPN
jgi:hypothetical protein